MTRLNVVLLLAVLASALYLVSVQYESRRLFADIDRAQIDARKLEAERERLELDKRELATPRRVEKLAKERLQMRVATPAITHYVTYAPSAGGETTDSGARAAGQRRAP